MIELLGVGVPRDDGHGWLLHRVCTQLESRGLVVAVSRDPAERRALLDAVTGRRQPDEGRVYVGRVAVTPETTSRLRARVGDADLAFPLEESRSVLWNALAARRPGVRALLGFLRLPRPGERQAALAALDRMELAGRASEPVSRLDREARVRLLIAREMARRPEHLVVRDLDLNLEAASAERVLGRLAILARSERLGVLASMESWSLGSGHADRVIVLAGGLLVFDGPPSGLTGESIARRFGPALRG